MEHFISTTTTLQYWQKPNLNYTWYWILAVFFGWCALDQLYLGTPQAFIIKLVANIFTFGYWWFYDALQATFNQPQVKAFGTSIPVYGSAGIGGGRFAETPDATHKNFLLYGIVLVAVGLFGGDSFLVGDNLSGYIRIISLFSFVFTPVAVIWWLYKLYLYFIRTDQILGQNFKYFGSPKPSDFNSECPNALEQFTAWIVDTGATVLDYIPIVNNIAPVLRAFANSLRVAYGITKTVVETASTVVSAGEKVTDVMNAVQPTADDISVATKKLTKQTGGSYVDKDNDTHGIVDSTQSIIFIIVIFGIIASGIIVNINKYKKNKQTNVGPTITTTDDKRRGERYNDDTPPEPRNI